MALPRVQDVRTKPGVHSIARLVCTRGVPVSEGVAEINPLRVFCALSPPPQSFNVQTFVKWLKARMKLAALEVMDNMVKKDQHATNNLR